jgi:hypothetical protein
MKIKMKPGIIKFLICLLLPLSCFSQPDNINISSTSSFEGEPGLAVNPMNTMNIVIGWMALDLSTGFKMSIKSKASFDGGATWGNEVIHPHMGSTWYSADVFIQFRSDGTVYMGYIDYHQSPDSGGVFLTHSADGGKSWSPPVQVFNLLTDDPAKRPVDRPWMAIENSGTANNGMIYVTSKPAPWILPPNRPYLKSSHDSSNSWSAWRYIDTTGYLVGNIIRAPMASPTITADGALCIAYPSYLISQSVYGKYFLAKSYNRGASFQYYDIVIIQAPVSDTMYKLGYCLAANPSNANQLAFAYPAQPNGDPDIFIITTDNGGTSWNIPVRVNDDVRGNGKAQDMVWASYDRNNKLVVTWRDRRNGTGTGFYQPSDTYCAVSSDNGKTFQRNVRLSNMTAPFDAILEQKGNDFLSCQSVSDSIYAAWGDVRTGNLNIFFAKTSNKTGLGVPPILVDGNRDKLLSVYPNPASGKLYITFLKDHPRSVGIKIFNENGEEFISKQFKNITGPTILDISKLLTGIYFIAGMDREDIIFSEKLIVK